MKDHIHGCGDGNAAQQGTLNGSAIEQNAAEEECYGGNYKTNILEYDYVQKDESKDLSNIFQKFFVYGNADFFFTHEGVYDKAHSQNGQNKGQRPGIISRILCKTTICYYESLRIEVNKYG